MTFLERLQAHKGSLICLKTGLRWRQTLGGGDKHPRVCLLLDVEVTSLGLGHRHAGWTHSVLASTGCSVTKVYLLIDGVPKWIWVAEEDIEMTT